MKCVLWHEDGRKWKAQTSVEMDYPRRKCGTRDVNNDCHKFREKKQNTHTHIAYNFLLLFI